MTGDRLFKYFTGKDDYTNVFKVEREEIPEVNELKDQEINE